MEENKYVHVYLPDFIEDQTFNKIRAKLRNNLPSSAFVAEGWNEDLDAWEIVLKRERLNLKGFALINSVCSYGVIITPFRLKDWYSVT